VTAQTFNTDLALGANAIAYGTTFGTVRTIAITVGS